MDNKFKIIFSGLVLIIFTNVNFAQVKLAQSGMKFLSVGADARAVAMGEATVSIEGNSSSMFYNPASMARQTELVNITFTNTQWIADIKYLNAAISFAPKNGLYGVFGLLISSVDYGVFHRTVIGPDGGALDIGTYSPTAMAAGISYARALSDKFSVGGNARYIYQNLGNGQVIGGDYNNMKTQKIDINVFSFDFGVLYKTGFKSLNLGMSIRNFSQEIAYFDESFQLPLTFKLGLSMNLLDLLNKKMLQHSFLFSVDAEHPRDNKEMLHFGGEYTFMDILSLRMGYVTPKTSQAGMDYGVGLKYNVNGFKLGVDYSYTVFDIFNNVHRFSIKLSF